MTFEFPVFGPLPFPVTSEAIKERNRKISEVYQQLAQFQERLRAERTYLYSLCKHADKTTYAEWDGSDGGQCHDCGKGW